MVAEKLKGRAITCAGRTNCPKAMEYVLTN